MTDRTTTDRATGPSPTPEPLALLVNLGAGTPKGAALRALFEQAGVRVRDVAPAQMADPAGYLAGLPGFSPAPGPYAGDAPDEEFLLLCNMPDEQVMELVRAMRAAGAAVGCKAALTEHSRAWAFIELMQEVCAEHAAMQAARAAAQQ